MWTCGLQWKLAACIDLQADHALSITRRGQWVSSLARYSRDIVVSPAAYTLTEEDTTEPTSLFKNFPHSLPNRHTWRSVQNRRLGGAEQKKWRRRRSWNIWRRRRRLQASLTLRSMLSSRTCLCWRWSAVPVTLWYSTCSYLSVLAVIGCAGNALVLHVFLPVRAGGGRLCR